jgi:hypothetical protein
LRIATCSEIPVLFHRIGATAWANAQRRASRELNEVCRQVSGDGREFWKPGGEVILRTEFCSAMVAGEAR